MNAPPHRRRRTPLRLRLLLLTVAGLLSVGTIELLLHAAPGLLPAWYRLRFPPNGVEFADPGVLDRTPVTGLPLPYGVDPHDGPPPHDLVDYGVAPPEASERDRAEVPRLVLPSDRDGLPNLDRPAEPELALVGDSFMVYGSQRTPPGLQMRLERRLTSAILNVGVAGIGPEQELYLLQQVVLRRPPKLVLWFFFGGNDLIDAFWLQHSIAIGCRTLGDLFCERRAPRLYLPSLFAELLRPAQGHRAPEVLPGFVPTTNPDRPVWFYPDTLRSMVITSEQLQQNHGWHVITRVLETAHRACQEAGAKFLVVYLPSKEQVMLPRVVADGELLRRYVASTYIGLPYPDRPDELLATVLQNRGVLEAALQKHCAASGIAFWSATARFEAFADRGAPAYYTADSHWRSEVQTDVADGVVEALDRLGLWPR